MSQERKCKTCWRTYEENMQEIISDYVELLKVVQAQANRIKELELTIDRLDKGKKISKVIKSFECRRRICYKGE